jgi:D-alanyl-D-alanine carboxypeptidase
LTKSNGNDNLSLSLKYGENMNNSGIESRINAIFEKASKKYSSRVKIQGCVYSEKLNIDYKYSQNEIEKPYHIASIGKMFTAALVFLLIEENKLTLDDKINKYLPFELLEKLFVYKGIDYFDNVTIKHLLGHTGGCADYIEDKVINGKNFMDLLLSEPDKIWTPEMTVNFTQNNQKTAGKPTECFNYSDTGYNLLGKIIENVTNNSLHENLHNRIFKPLKMDDTYLMFHSSPINGIKPIENIWINNKEISKYKSLSCDWAGGGIISTISDLLKFNKALQTGELINNDLLYIMRNPVNKVRYGLYYGLGQMTIDIKKFTFTNSSKYYGHSGFFSTQLYYEPNSDIHIILNIGIAEFTAIKDCFKIIIKINKELSKK